MWRSLVLICGSVSLLPWSALALPISPLICSNPGSTAASSTDTSINANSCTDFSYPLTSAPPATGANNWLYGYLTEPDTASATLNPATFQLMTPTPALNSNGAIIPNQYMGWYSQNFFVYYTSLDAFGGHSNASYTDLHQIGTPSGLLSSDSYCTWDAPYHNCSLSGGLDTRSPTGPDSGNYWADRRYVVPDFTGTVSITMQAQKDPRTAMATSQPTTDYVLLDHNGTVTILNPGGLYEPVSLSGTEPVVSWTGDVNVSPGDFIDFVIVPYWNSTLGGYADFASGQFQLDTITSLAQVPEAGTFLLLGAGMCAFGLLRRRARSGR